jgi:hypothetical protein
MWWETDTSQLFYDTGAAWIGPLNVSSGIADGSVTLAKLAANSVDASKIVDGSVATAELAAGAVTAAKIAAALFPSGGAGASTEALRAIGSSAGMVLGGDDVRIAGYGISLPGSPVDKQRFTLTDSVTAPTWEWELRYNAAIANWGFLGGTTLEAVASAALTLPRAGSYRVWISGQLDSTGNNPIPRTATATPSTGSITGRNAIHLVTNVPVGGTYGEIADLAAQFTVAGISAGGTLTWTGDVPAFGVIRAVPLRVS